MASSSFLRLKAFSCLNVETSWNLYRLEKMKLCQEEKISIQRLEVISTLTFLSGRIQILFGQSCVNSWTRSAWSQGKGRLWVFKLPFWYSVKILSLSRLYIFWLYLIDISGPNHLQIFILPPALKHIFLALLVLHVNISQCWEITLSWGMRKTSCLLATSYFTALKYTSTWMS